VVPWVAPPERNFEEVFKRYRYFSIRNLDDGRFALVSLWEDDGVLVVYDAGTWSILRKSADL